MPSSTFNSKRKQDKDLQPDAFMHFNPLNMDEEIEMCSEVNDAFPKNKGTTSSGIGTCSWEFWSGW